MRIPAWIVLSAIYLMSALAVPAQELVSSNVFFIGIGVEKCADGTPGKPNAVADVRAVAARTHHDVDGTGQISYPYNEGSKNALVTATKVYDHFLFNEMATKENIDSLFAEVAAKAQMHDIFYFYIAALSAGDQGGFVIPISSFARTQGRSYAYTAGTLDIEHLNGIFSQIPCRNQMIIVDNITWSENRAAILPVFLQTDSSINQAIIAPTDEARKDSLYTYRSNEQTLSISLLPYVICSAERSVLTVFRKDQKMLDELQLSLRESYTGLSHEQLAYPGVFLSWKISKRSTGQLQTMGVDGTRGVQADTSFSKERNDYLKDAAKHKVPSEFLIESGKDFFRDSMQLTFGVYAINELDTVPVSSGYLVEGRYCIRYNWKDLRKDKNRKPVAVFMYLAVIDTTGKQVWLTFPEVFSANRSVGVTILGNEGETQGSSTFYNLGGKVMTFKVTPPYGKDKYVLLLREKPLRLQQDYKNDLLLRIWNNPMSTFTGDYASVMTYISIPRENVNKAAAPAQLSPLLMVVKPEAGLTRGVTLTDAVTYNVRGSAYHPLGIEKVIINTTEVAYDTLLRCFEGLVTLHEGENQINVEVYSKSGTRSQESFYVICNTSTVRITSPGRTWFLGIGIDAYDNWTKLNNAVSDMKAVKICLEKNFQFRPEYAMVITDQNATREAIIDSISAMAARLDSSDNLFIYYSGHGYFDPVLKEGYWVPVDGRVNKRSDYVSNAEILKILSAYQVKHLVMMVDACFSGSLFANEVATRGSTYTAKTEAFDSRWGLCSGRLEVVADGTAGKHSPFAEVVLRYMESAKQDFTITQLAQYVLENVANNSRQTPVYGRFRDAGDEGGEFVFHVKK